MTRESFACYDVITRCCLFSPEFPKLRWLYCIFFTQPKVGSGYVWVYSAI